MLSLISEASQIIVAMLVATLITGSSMNRELSIFLLRISSLWCENGCQRSNKHGLMLHAYEINVNALPSFICFTSLKASESFCLQRKLNIEWLKLKCLLFTSVHRLQPKRVNWMRERWWIVVQSCSLRTESYSARWGIHLKLTAI